MTRLVEAGVAIGQATPRPLLAVAVSLLAGGVSALIGAAVDHWRTR